MAESHHRSGELALLRYNVVKGPEITTALDPSSAPTGNTNFVLMEVYETPAGLGDHWNRAVTDWKDFGAFMEWASQIKVEVLHGAEIIHSLW
jgi:hypothetical protein